MAHAGDVIENPVSGQRLIFRVTSADSDGELFAKGSEVMNEQLADGEA